MITAWLTLLIGSAWARQAMITHSAGPTDTIRYSRDEFGLTLHVDAASSLHPLVLYPGARNSVRSAPMIRVSATEFRGRIAAKGELRYAFWVDPEPFKVGLVGSILDATGAHETAEPTWFEQAAAGYHLGSPPHWPLEGMVFYALDTDIFGDGSFDEAGAKGFTKHMDYVTGLGVTGIWLNAVHGDSGDTVEDSHQANLKIVAEGAGAPKGADGYAGDTVGSLKGWRVAEANQSVSATVRAGLADTAQDPRWRTFLVQFIKDQTVSPETIGDEILGLRGDYPDAAAEQLVLRLAGPGQPRPSAVFQGNRNELLQAWLLFFTLPGVPVIDSGDEVGDLDSGDRMIWDPTRQDSIDLTAVKKFINLRATRPSLYRGAFTILKPADGEHVFAFARTDRFETTLVLVNNGDDSQPVRVGVNQVGFGANQLRDLYGSTSFNDSSGVVTLTLPAHGFALIGT